MIQFADRMSMLKGSEIREFMALTAKSDFISLPAVCQLQSCFPQSRLWKQLALS